MRGWRNLPAGRQVGIRKVRMFEVYVLKSNDRNYIYVGLSSNLQRRLREHQEGLNKTTRPYRPFEVVLTEVFSTRLEARRREKYFKSGAGKEWIKLQIK